MSVSESLSSRVGSAAFKRGRGRPRTRPFPEVPKSQVWDGRIVALAALCATTVSQPEDPHVVPIHSRPRTVDIKGDIWSAQEWREDGERGILLTCQRSYHAGGTVVEHWFWGFEDLKALGIAQGAPRRIEV